MYMGHMYKAIPYALEWLCSYTACIGSDYSNLNLLILLNNSQVECAFCKQHYWKKDKFLTFGMNLRLCQQYKLIENLKYSARNVYT